MVKHNIKNIYFTLLNTKNRVYSSIYISDSTIIYVKRENGAFSSILVDGRIEICVRE